MSKYKDFSEDERLNLVIGYYESGKIKFVSGITWYRN